MTANKKCRECRWWCGGRNKEGFPIYGDCRVGAPQIVQIGDTNSGIEHDTVWPRTEARDWCACWTDESSDWVPIAQPTLVAIQNMCRAFEETMGINPMKDERK